MSTNPLPLIDLFSSFDYKKEQKRWNRFCNILNEPEPKVGQTPRKVVWQKNKTTLWHYPAEEKKYEVPVLLVYSLFNKSFIFDLAPGTSIIEALVKAGYDVYLLDWGTPEYEDKGITFDDYIVDYLQKGVRRVLRHSNADEISIIGYCIGGTIASMYTAIADEAVKNLIVAAVPIDFSVSAVPVEWIEGMKNGIFSMDRLIDVYGLIPSYYVGGLFQAVSSPINNSPYVALLNRAHDDKFVEKWQRMNKWTNEHVPVTGEAFRQFINDLLKDNKLIKGEMTVRGEKVDLAKIKSNLLVISSKKDHLVPKEQSLPLLDAVSSEDKTTELVDAGHVTLTLTSQFATLIDSWLSERSRSLQTTK